MFAKDDIVRVVKQPESRGSHVIPPIVGEVAVVDEVVEGDRLQIILLLPDGSLGGGGAIPASCVVKDETSQGAEAARRYRARMDALEKALKERSDQHRLKVLDLALKYDITPEAVLDIHKTLRDFEDEGRH